MKNAERTALSLILVYLGVDFWDRPVYKDQHNNLWKNVDLHFSDRYALHSVINNEYEGEPDMPVPEWQKVVFIGEPEKCPCEFEMQMFGRLVSDCKYYLGAGDRYEGHLWGKTVKEHINAMRDFLKKIPRKWRNEFFCENTIRKYELAMLGEECRWEKP